MLNKAILLDTSFLYALNDADDRNHEATVRYLQTIPAIKLLLPVPVLPELCYLLASRLGHQAMRQFLQGLPQSDIELTSLEFADLGRINELMTQYVTARLDFTDTAIITMAERLNITHILTFDRRDFSIIRPKHVAYFELLP